VDQIKKLLDVFLHLNTHLDGLVAEYGAWVYGILFLLNLWVAMAIILIAAVLGDTVNYWVGNRVGHKVVERFPRLVKQKHLDRTHQFFERYGGKTIIIARFVPIVRTFAPFVAGVGAMTYRRFMAFNVVGALLWVGLITPAGYFFANIPVVKQNFSIVILAIIFVSTLPAMVEFLREWRKSRIKPPQEA
jgi:membrane-associated protein